ncbi:aminopeptidase P family N-terminal domain-containing protein [Ramlibacter sp. AW1]|uniref:Aminopeptidase P family N-terminal domain-containing protein n=1 Tax=Ramlibacter aurantiacus TaxID=2801330 RepID=A0A937D3H1_9BURK|nr:aminopeptidase P family N-terminal domain-containing protein [Ramlibacter aurantiacus]MBL0422659.1 aminopeptidase P family N-terminal domain-containing protein [Ramlibacter aurantiacus]
MRRGLMKWLPEEMPAEVLDGRVQRLQAVMREDGLHAVLAYTSFARPAAVHWLTHFTPYWSEALCIVPREGHPVLLAALTPRVHAWMREVSHVGELVSAPKLGPAAARWLAEHLPADARFGVISPDALPWALSEPLHDAFGARRLVDATESFRRVRQPADEAERGLARRAASIARAAIDAVPPGARDTCALAAAADGSARRAGAEEVLLRVAPDLRRSDALLRLEGERALAATHAVELSVAYKGVWVRLARSFARGDAPPAWAAAQDWFDRAAATPASLRALAEGRLAPPAGHAIRWTLEACTGLQPLSVVAAGEAGQVVGAASLPTGTLCVLSASSEAGGQHWVGGCALAILPEGLRRLDRFH